MNAAVAGMAVGATLAICALVFGFWGFLLVALFIALGAVVGRIVEGQIDFQGVMAALRGKRSV